MEEKLNYIVELLEEFVGDDIVKRVKRRRLEPQPPPVQSNPPQVRTREEANRHYANLFGRCVEENPTTPECPWELKHEGVLVQGSVEDAIFFYKFFVDENGTSIDERFLKDYVSELEWMVAENVAGDDFIVDCRGARHLVDVIISNLPIRRLPPLRYSSHIKRGDNIVPVEAKLFFPM